MTNDYNTQLIEEFRRNDGHVGGPWEGIPLVLVHDIGAKSGIEHVTPLRCFPRGNGRFLVVASNGGSPTHPAWYHNLKANPRVDVEVGAETVSAVAEELDETARAELWPQLAAQVPQIDDQANVTRQIQVIMLTRRDV